MTILKAFVAYLGTTALATTFVLAQEKMEEKGGEKKAASAVLHPEMEPTGGWTSAGKMGEKPAQPWTDTTIAAGVEKKPLEGRVVTRTGEIVDLSCYLQLGKHGDKHASCGKKCLAAGQPIGLLTNTGAIYMLMEEEHDPRRDGQTNLRQAASDNFAKVMTVTGTETTVHNVRAIFVQGYVKK
jgi:hypothetical protein